MAHEDDSFEAKFLDDGLHILGEAGNAPILPILARFSVSRLVESDDAIVAGESVDLVLPPFTVATPAVQEHESGVSGAANFVDDAEAVRSANRPLGCLRPL